MKSYKILIVTDAWHPQVNGVVTTLNYLVEELKKQNHEVFPTPGIPTIMIFLFSTK